MAGSSVPERPSIACTSTKGATPIVPGCARASSLSRAQSGCRPSLAVTVACAVSATSRPRNSPSKPFITEMIVINAATPTQTPSIDIQLMKETKNPRPRVRT